MKPATTLLSQLAPRWRCFFSLLAAALLSATASAATITVNSTVHGTDADSATTTLAEAIIQANGNGQANIILLPAAAYFLLDDATYTDSTSLGRTMLPAITTNITIQGNGSTLDATGKNARFFYVSGAGALTLEDVNLTGGTAQGGAGANGYFMGGGGGAGMGGAIFVNGSTASLVMRRSAIMNCAAKGGIGGGFADINGPGGGGGGMGGAGAVAGGGGPRSAASGDTGGDGVGGNASSAGGMGGGGGGGRQSSAAGVGGFGGGGGGAWINNGSYGAPGAGGFAGGGGGAFMGSPANGGAFGGRGALYNGGGVGNGGGGGGLGGGIFNLQGTVTLENVTLLYNTAKGGDGSSLNGVGAGAGVGGGIFNYDGAVTMKHVTANGNMVQTGVDNPGIVTGGAIYNYDAPGGATPSVTLYNSIFSSSNAIGVDVMNDGSGTITAAGASSTNLIKTSSGVTGTVLTADPALGMPERQSGKLFVRLQATSPALDAGDDANSLTTDVAGSTRPSGAHVDLGAVEGPATNAAVTLATGTLVVGDTNADAVFAVDPVTGKRTLISKLNYRGTGPDIGNPRGIALDPQKNIYVVNTSPTPASIVKIDPATGNRTTISSSAVGTGPAFSSPSGLAWRASDSKLIVTDTGGTNAAAGGDPVFVVDPVTGDRTILSDDVTPDTLNALSTANAVMVHSTLGIVVSDASTTVDQVVKVNAAGGGRTVLSSNTVPDGANPLSTPAGLAEDADGSILLVDSGVRQLLRVQSGTGVRSVVASYASPEIWEGVTAGTAGIFITKTSPNPDNIYKVNPGNGSLTVVASNAAGDGPLFGAPNTSGVQTVGFNLGIVLVSGPVYTPPVVTSPASSSISATRATLGGNVTSDNGNAVTARGVVYAKTAQNANPQIGGANVTNVAVSGTTGSFTTNLTGLSSATGYSFAAYATNQGGTTYTAVSTFTTTGAPTVTTPNLAYPPLTEGSSATFSISGTFADAGGAAAAPFTAVVQWGDGSTSAASVSGSNYSFSGSHTYAQSGSYAITVKVTNADSLTGTSGAQNVTVANAAPVVAQPATFSPLAAVTGDSTAFTISGSFTDAAGAGDGTFTGVVNWGDSTTSAVTISGSGNPFTYSFSGTHTYAAAGNKNVTVTITDKDAGAGSSSQVAVTVYSRPTVTSPTSANVQAFSATLGGNVTSDGGSAVTARGVVLAPTAQNGNPQLGGANVINVTASGTTGVFTVNATGLQLNTAYSFAAYATNSGGTSYTTAGTFTTPNVTYKLGTTEVTEGADASASAVQLSVFPETGTWTATANAAWLHLSAPNQAGSGSATVVFTIDANTGANSRTGTLTVAGSTVTVTQAGSGYVAANPIATLAETGLVDPTFVTTDSSGNVYFTDRGLMQVKKWDRATNTVSTVAFGTFTAGSPAGIAMNAAGDIYVADYFGGSIRKKAGSNGVVTTVASGLTFPFSLALDPAGDLYIGCIGENVVRKLTTSSGTVSIVPGLNVKAEGLATDVVGNVYVADEVSGTVKKWTASTGVLSTVAFTGLSTPAGVAVDGAGKIYVADRGDKTVKMLNIATGAVSTLVATDLSYPQSLSVDGQGSVYIADPDNHLIKERARAFVKTTGQTKTYAAGSGTLAPVLPAGVNLGAPFVPKSSATWLAVESTTNDVVGYSVAANYSVLSRTAKLTVLGQDVSITQEADIAASVSVLSGNNQSATVATAFGSALSVTVKDADEHELADAIVTFSMPAAGASGSFAGNVLTATTDAAGVASSPTFTANTTAGTYAVSASVAGVTLPASFALKNTAGQPAVVQLVSGSGQSATVVTDFATPLTAEVQDTYGNAVPQATVTFALPQTGAGGSFTGSATVAADSSGQATSPTLHANSKAGTFTVQASAGNASAATFTLTNTAAAPWSIIGAAGQLQTATVKTNYVTALQAYVADQYGNAVPGAAVTFTPPASGAGGEFLQMAQVSTGSAGLAVAPTFQANSKAGSFTVTAQVTNTALSTSFTLTNMAGSAAKISAAAGAGQSATVDTEFALPLKALVTDDSDNPVQGAAVNFKAPDLGASGAFTASSVVTTDADGLATSPSFKANTKTGSYSAVAILSGAGPAVFALTNTAGAPAVVTATAGSGQSATVGTLYSTRLQASVVDSFGNAVNGATVTFASPASGASGSFSGGNTALTDASGVATANSFKANNVAGAVAVSATSGSATAASYSLTNTAGAVAKITAAAGTPQSATVNTAYATALQALVTDQFDNPVSGVAVTFTPPGSGASGTFTGAGTGTTNAQGLATAPAFKANATPGDFTVTASAASLDASAEFALTNFSSITTGAGTYNGLSQSALPTEPTHESAGLIRVTVSRAKAQFTATLKLGADRYTVRGLFDESGAAKFGKTGTAEQVLKRKNNLPELRLTLRLVRAVQVDELVGEITEGGQPYATIAADRALYTAQRSPELPLLNVPAELVGKYTVYLAPGHAAPGSVINLNTISLSGDSSQSNVSSSQTVDLAGSRPCQGYGVGLLSVNASGVARLTGTLADGTAFSYSNSLSKLNRWPFYVALAGGKGAVSGPVTFRGSRTLQSDLDGLSLSWFKPARPAAKVYPAGWMAGQTLDLLGSKFEVTPGESILPGLGAPSTTGNANVEFTSGNMVTPGYAAAVNISTDNKSTAASTVAGGIRMLLRFPEIANGVTRRVVHASPGEPVKPVPTTRTIPNGAFTGTFTHPQTGKRTAFKGVIFQKQRVGVGFFLGSTESGAVVIAPPAP